ncbi:hypothetical protein ACHAQA_010007 [Verticillium albo-atrum]
MALYSLLCSAAFIGVSTALAQPAQEAIEWGSCDEALSSIGRLPVQCGNITVPLDYADPESDMTLELPLLRVPALKQPSKGSIIFHYGGPGPGGRESMAAFGELMHVMTGQGFDLVGWDQRGTVDVMPISCYNSSEERLFSPASKANIAVKPEDRVDIGRNWAFGAQEANNCYEYAKDKGGDLVGTSYTVRDVMQMVDALGGDQMLRFWGLSYGTVVGATFAAMFPDRVERIVLDGVQNIHEYYYGSWEELVADSDKVFSAFLRTCFERPQLCDLAKHNPNATSDSIERKIYDVIDSYKFRPHAFTHEVLKDQLLDQNFIKALIRPRLYNPGNYPVLANLLHLLLSGDLEGFTDAYVDALDGVGDVFTGGLGNDAAIAIPCSDQSFRTDDLNEALPLINKMVQRSRLVGDMMSWNINTCAQWSLPAKERFERGFHEPIDTKNPLLIIGNEYDVVTPFISAQNASASFPGSSLVKFNAHGHSTPQQPSLCTAKMTREYFESGTLPPVGTVCEPAAHPWDTQSWPALYPELGYEMANETSKT